MLAPDASSDATGSNKASMPKVFILFLAAALAAGRPAEAGTESAPQFLSYSGVAVATASGKFLYTEHHLLKYEKGQLRERVVLYTCADGSAFARKAAQYVQPLAPDFAFEDSSNGVREGVRNDRGLRTVFFRSGREAEEKTAPLKTGQNWVIDAGFDEFIHQNWESLMLGHPMSLYFLVPSRLSGVNFQLQHVVGSAQSGATETFRLKVAGVLGWVLPSIDVVYDADDHVLRRYEGVSELRDATGENLRTAITFGAGQRRSAEPAEFAAATQAALAPCRG